MNYEIAAPRASALVESLRGVGYSPSTAIADLVDNSISAGARNIWLTFKFDGPMSTISLLDDGCGMSEVDLRQAMVLGARNPLDARPNGDLGRFGLGLKTASFSQCRCLTVASRKDDSVSVRRWDLDYLTKMEADDWRLLIGPRDGSEALLSPLTQVTTGTLVVWETLDRIIGGARCDDRKAEDAFNAMIEAVDHHLGMVFQRFLDRPNSPLRLYVNGRRVRAWDPFMRSHPATEFTPLETITAQSGMVTLQGFVLPHKDQMSEDDLRRGAGNQGWAAHQGFYIYRGNRLMVAGGWLGLGTPRPWTMEEPYRLARISVDFDNTADSSWEIDVKKSVARPPRQLRPRMGDLAEVVRAKARRVFAHRGTYGTRAPVSDLVPAWESGVSVGGARYRVNRAHPIIARVLENAGSLSGDVEAAFRIIEATVPVERIWLDTTEQGEVVDKTSGQEAPAALADIGGAMIRHWMNRIGMTTDQAAARLNSTDPFQNFPELVARLRAEATVTEPRT